MKRVDQAACSFEDYAAPTVEIIVVATERGIAASPDSEELPPFIDGGSAF